MNSALIDKLKSLHLIETPQFLELSDSKACLDYIHVCLFVSRVGLGWVPGLALFSPLPEECVRICAEIPKVVNSLRTITMVLEPGQKGLFRSPCKKFVKS